MSKSTSKQKASRQKQQVNSKKNSVDKKASPKQRMQAFLRRRPHRSFQRSYRSDYVRSLSLPGYVAFTRDTVKILHQYRGTFMTMIAVFSVVTALFVGVTSQEVYRQIIDAVNTTGEDVFSGGWGEIGKATLLLTSLFNGSASSADSTTQLYGALLSLFIWLTTVWFLRAVLSSPQRHVPKFRTALYNAGAPLVSTMIVSLIVILQLIPAGLAAIAYSAALATDFLANPLYSIVFFLVTTLMIVLSIYLLISTFFALIVVTLPGMYPWQAIRTAGDMVVGRRLRILLRMAWMVLVVVLVLAIIGIPLILIVNWLQSLISFIAWMPIVPLLLLVLSTSMLTFGSVYTYMLYRKVLDDDAATA